MKTKKYIVKRENIYVGEVVKVRRVYRYRDNNGYYMDADRYKSSRSILFVPDDNGYSNDLLYNSNQYPVLGLFNDSEALNIKRGSIVVRNAHNLSSLLEYLNYNEDLTYNDIKHIRKLLFNGKFPQENCELFGYKKIITKDNEIKYQPSDNFTLYQKYFNLLSDFGDRTFNKVADREDLNMNAFKSAFFEKKVKRLKRK